MPRKDAPEFYWSEKRQEYRKRFKGADGKWHDAWGKTKQLCRQRKRDLEDEISDEVAHGYPVPTELTVAAYAKKWYNLYTVDLKSSTRARYRTSINTHICPALGNKALSEVKYDDIMELMVSCSKLSKATKKKILGTTRKIFDAAVKNGHCKNNPCQDIKVNGPPAAKREALTKQQQAQLLAAVYGTKAELFTKLCLFAGLRREEALGLFWDCVHLDAETPYLSVRRALNFTDNGQPDLVEYGKSDAAMRDIPLPPPLHAVLKSARQDSGPVIRNSAGTVMSKQSFRRLWDAVTARTVHEAIVQENGKKVRRMLEVGEKIPRHNVMIMIDFKVTPHMLRHTYISELILAGADVKTAQYLAGHASAQLTLDIYTHLMENRPKDTASAVLAAFGGQI